MKLRHGLITIKQGAQKPLTSGTSKFEIKEGTRVYFEVISKHGHTPKKLTIGTKEFNVPYDKNKGDGSIQFPNVTGQTKVANSIGGSQKINADTQVTGECQ